MKKNSYMTIALLVILGITSACTAHSDEKPPTPVKMKEVEMLSAPEGLRYSASITARTQIELAFKVGGYVSDIHQVRGIDHMMRNVQEGDYVAQGTVLAGVRRSDYAVKVSQAESEASQAKSALDSSKAQVTEAQSSIESARAQLAQTQASYERASLDYERAKNLFASQSMTKSDYDAAKSQFEAAQAQLNAGKSQVAVAEAKARAAHAQVETVQAQIRGGQAVVEEARISLGDTALRAPMNSVVLERRIEKGLLVSPGTTAFVLADTTSVKAVFGVPDFVVEDLKLGNPIAVTTEALLGEDFQGQITAISPSADAKSRVFEVEVTIPNQQKRLKVGMVVALSLANKNEVAPMPVVPLSAIVKSKESPDSYAVFVIEDQGGKPIARSRNVKLGEAYGNTVAILEGLKVKDRVITTGASMLIDGERVQIVP
jgi:multidrug efflux system membrane fusion protein